MKTSRFSFLFLLLAGFFINEAQSQSDSYIHYDSSIGAQPGPLLQDHFSFPPIDNSRLGEPERSDVTPSQLIDNATAQEASMSLFYNWLYRWFLVGKYAAYKSPKWIYQSAKETPSTKLKSKNKTTPYTKHAKKGQQTSKKGESKKRVSASLPVPVHDGEVPEKYQDLVSSVSSQGITFNDLSTIKKPDDFPSEWVWIVIGWIDNALKQAQGQYLSNMSFDDVLANTDPALPAIVRGTLRAALFVEDSDGENDGGSDSELFSDTHVALTIGWMDYMFLRYNCPLNWREWLVSKPKFNKGSLQQSEEEDLISFDIDDSGIRSIAKKLKLSENHLNRMERPRVFRSIGLWIIIEEFNSDTLYCLDASSFSTIFRADLIFADTVSSVLFEIFSAKSALNQKELYLMEYWLDKAVERLQTQTGTFLAWRDLMSLAPNNQEYFAAHPSMAVVAPPSQPQGAINTPKESDKVIHRNMFGKTKELNQLLTLQLQALDTDEDEDENEDSDYEVNGEGYF